MSPGRWTMVGAGGLCRLRRLLGGSSGQASVEYVATTTILVLGGIGFAGGWPYFGTMMNAFDRYLASVHFVLSMALP